MADASCFSKTRGNMVLIADQQRYALSPFTVNIRQYKRMHKVASLLRSATVLDHNDFEKADLGIMLIRKGTNRHALADRDPKSALRRRRPCSPACRVGVSMRSIVAALIDASLAAKCGSRSRCPCRCIASSKVGRIAFSSLPQTQSAASRSRVTTSRTDPS